MSRRVREWDLPPAGVKSKPVGGRSPYKSYEDEPAAGRPTAVMQAPQLLFAPPERAHRVREWELPPAGVLSVRGPDDPPRPGTAATAGAPSALMQAYQKRAPRRRGVQEDAVAGMTSAEIREAETRKKADHRRPSHLCGHQTVSRVDMYPRRQPDSRPVTSHSSRSIGRAFITTKSARQSAKRRLKKALSAARLAAHLPPAGSPDLASSLSVMRLATSPPSSPGGGLGRTLPPPSTPVSVMTRPSTSSGLSRSMPRRPLSRTGMRPASMALTNKLGQRAEPTGYWQNGASVLGVAGLTMFNEAHADDGDPSPDGELVYVDDTELPLAPSTVDGFRTSGGGTAFTIDMSPEPSVGTSVASSRVHRVRTPGTRPRAPRTTGRIVHVAPQRDPTPDLMVASSSHGFMESDLRQLLKRISDAVYSLPRGVHGAYKKMSVDGEVDARALYHGLRRIGCDISEEEAAAALGAFDYDGDAMLSRSEFVHMLTAASKV